MPLSLPAAAHHAPVLRSAFGEGGSRITHHASHTMADTLKLQIVTPDGEAYSEDVNMVTLPGVEGQLGVYPQHVPLMTQMTPGEIVVRKDGHDYYLAVGEGLIEVMGDHVAVLTDLAISSEKIDEAKVEEARQRAEARLKEKLSDEEVASVNASLVRSAVQLRVKRRQRPG
jgi:F-type H+-transporting ATPase subunit epsilon